MKRFVSLSLLSGVAFLCLSAGAGQAAVSGSGLTVSHPTALVQQVYWRCWWRHHHRHCRHWW
ncbi:MAG TPA: hypothetical protein VLW88_00225 [Hyphomicrobium sp.]|jgi:hypothetical protein|nr:hypothetical protein [Hyphomicrobium sp.]